MAGHLNNNHQPESNNDAALVQPDADENAMVRPRQKGKNATTARQKEPEEDAIAISPSINLLRSDTNMDSLQQNLDGPKLGETSFEDVLSFLTIGEKTKRKKQKQLILGLDYLQAKNIKMSLGHTLIINKKANENVQEKTTLTQEKKNTTGQQSALRSTKESLPAQVE